MLYVEAKTWNCRPSDLLDIEDRYVAYCLDQACGYYGRVIENELGKIEAKNQSDGERQRKLVMDRFFGVEDKPTRGAFADPAAMFT